MDTTSLKQKSVRLFTSVTTLNNPSQWLLPCDPYQPDLVHFCGSVIVLGLAITNYPNSALQRELLQLLLLPGFLMILNQRLWPRTCQKRQRLGLNGMKPWLRWARLRWASTVCIIMDPRIFHWKVVVSRLEQIKMMLISTFSIEWRRLRPHLRKIKSRN